MKQLNYNHLHYFYIVAREGSIASAARQLHVTAQTVSGQLATFEAQLGHPLFDRVGKRLHLNPKGKRVYQYAETIFHNGMQLLETLRSDNSDAISEFVIGLTDAIPKVLAFDFIHETMAAHPQVRFVFKEERFDTLVSEMAINHIDLVLADRGVAPGAAVKFSSHTLGKSAVSFFAAPALATRLKPGFPHSLNGQPLLMPGVRSGIAMGLINWLESEQIVPLQIADFDDSALLKLFGAKGFGVFCAPSCIAAHVEQQYQVVHIGRIDSLTEQFFALTRQYQSEQRVACAIINRARSLLISAR
ncbi:LysR family transcriptional regulator [Salinimonas sediminis]|uniref:LysR family transcriptional regulator n=1 Tax=Salinimonas sediminis TaxID=2303538 RepID=A0A346NPY8_9ALTE|nr:LysR family transcriptional regulator [Salinimonas sediminis]AXR07595.1 LysR family transcriptional regulator [Salinimonas sediminis]